MITIEIISVLVYVGLLLLMSLVQAAYSFKTAGAAYNLSNHERPQLNKGPIGIRIDNTLNNLKEGALIYLPLTLLVVSLEVSNTWTYYAALVTIIARILYVPIYVAGITTLRSVVFAFSLFAVPAMFIGLLIGT
jgi:uncharacterized MAPEG superfamily protein